MYLKLSSSLSPPGRPPSVMVSGWGRNGMCRCPFLDDKTPSMKVDRRFHCFGCGADGDAIDFVSRLEAVSPKEAALMLAQAFFRPL